ncbi:hypothetical protein GCM10007079_00720 [Nocardiopsis terrae]|uniref:DUF4352 domain-containing protein n=1 Tax=Nocardiopsis terrae TaxID=372655 RepID=A0ABR9HM95_9ACTN|nr:DUF4352 domain-containing protein [Nocardiopsis terrae]MBE1460124.1 hypothetical protein [Nocardiopsis terrae]GHC69823.1 hypothetical protein GCM10007079_00720 [Nocardiopsis terrae]
MTHPQYPGDAPQPPKKKSPALLFGCLGCSGLILLVLIVVGALALGSGDEDGATEDSTSADSGDGGGNDEAADEGADEDLAGIGDRVEVGGLAFTVTGVEDGLTEASGALDTYTAEGQYVAVSVTVENTGNEPTYFENTAQKLYDAEGREFGHDSDATIALDEGPMLGELNPAQSGDFTVVFDIPADAEVDRIEVSDDMFEDGGTPISLKG